MPTKRIKDLTSTATAADLLSSRYGVLDTPDITKKLPGNLLGGGGGSTVIAGTIYPSLQEAIADAANLAVGNLFETNGFYTSGDGGAARYLVSDTGIANGMDIIQLAAGKLAVLQVGREAFVEQVGYEPKSSADAASDLTPYIQRLLAMNVLRIKFKATYLYYYMKTPLIVGKHDAEFVGGLDTFSGYSSRIEYVPGDEVTEDYCFKLNARRIKFKHLYINDNPTRTHICFKTDNPNGNHEGYVFDGLNISLFDIAFSLCGSVNWQHTFNRVRFNQCRLGLYTQNTFFMNLLTECYFSCLEEDVFSESEYNAVTFMNCNFECLNRCVHFSYWKQDPELAGKLFTLTDAKFICCSFEFHTPQDVPSNVQGCFIYVDDFVQAKLNLDTQNLSLRKLGLTDPAVTDTTCFSFGENTYATFVSVRGQDFSTYWSSKFLWDNSRHPAKDVGAITLVNSYNIPRPSFGDLYLPTFRGNDGVIYFSNATNILVNYPSLKDGDKLFNLDDGRYYTKSADQLIAVSDSPSNFVRIGDELYRYVVIGNKKWITRNLRLQTTNSKILFKKETGLKEEWGLYYPFGDRTELSAKLPTGWRVPTKTDLDDLIASLPGSSGSEKARNAQSTQYPSVFPNATNSSGLNIPPSQQYEGTSYVRGYFMSNTSKYTLVVNANGILEYDITPDYPNLMSPIRVCADV